MNQPKQPPIQANAPEPTPEALTDAPPAEAPARPRLDPTRYGDWELNGKCVDF